MRLRVGPLPTAEIAERDAGMPTVRAMSDVAIGEDSTGTTLWRTEGFDPPAVPVGEDSPITVFANRP